jgi:hypothetical protein
MFLAIPAARFILRELHSVLGDKWGGRDRLTPHPRRDLQWWTKMPSHANGKNINAESRQLTYNATVPDIVGER